MLCRNRWAGLEQEGFGIVFVEAAACGVPQVAGDSGGAAEAVVDGVTGLVVRRPDDVATWPRRSSELLDDPDSREPGWGTRPRERAVREFSYDVLAHRLGARSARCQHDGRMMREPCSRASRRPLRADARRRPIGDRLFVDRRRPIGVTACRRRRVLRSGQGARASCRTGAVRRSASFAVALGVHDGARTQPHRGDRRGQPVPAHRLDDAPRPVKRAMIGRSSCRSWWLSATAIGDRGPHGRVAAGRRWRSASSCRCSASA